MKNVFVPGGTVTFRGSFTELNALLYDLYGKMENDTDFCCHVSVPSRKRHDGISIVIMRGRTSFLFRGSIIPSGEQYKITYKVYPTLTSVLFLLLPVYFFFRVLFMLPYAVTVESVIALCFVSVVLIGIFLLLRRFAIRQFVKKFEEHCEDDEGIFD